jgi:hypothetical protein
VQSGILYIFDGAAEIQAQIIARGSIYDSVFRL